MAGNRTFQMGKLLVSTVVIVGVLWKRVQTSPISVIAKTAPITQADIQMDKLITFTSFCCLFQTNVYNIIFVRIFIIILNQKYPLGIAS